ncbi:MAG: glycosyltransferase [Balneola sp.]|nr:MAG: glycosyltransferase [Balneola sp.]
MRETQSPDITIVVVNYKVKEYILNLLSSINKAQGKLVLQIIVVDNNSQDDSIEFLQSRFPDVTYISNTENLGFGKANNQAIEVAEGKYALIINPDTLVSEDTLSELIKHMEANPDCGAAGCKILNPDGSFAPESKRSVPTIWSSFTKVTGLSTLFPKSKFFSEYYLDWLDENEKSKVPVLSGSFMFWRTELLKELGGFDERFFMYGEDIDLCYRVQDTEYHIDYLPTTSIIHYKGESTKKGDLKYTWIFNKALYQFFDKHHSSNYSFLFKVFIYSSIWVRGILSLITSNLKGIGYIASDLLLFNISIVLGFLIRFEFSYEVVSNLQNLQFLWINVLASFIYVILGAFLDLFRSNKESISNQIKAIGASYAGVALVTFFVREYAFSRLALIYGLASALILMLVVKVIQINKSKSDTKVTGKLKRLKVLIVGNEEETSEIRTKIHSRPDWNYEVIGRISPTETQSGALGTVSQLKDLIRAYQVDQVFFALKSISYKEMLLQISDLQNEKVVFKLVPDSMDFILGKSNVEYLESIPLVQVQFDYSKTINQLLKRLFDIVFSAPLLVVLLLLTLPSLLFTSSKKIKAGSLTFYENPQKNKWKNRVRLLWFVFTGRMSFVGNAVYSTRSTRLKPGFTGNVQMNKPRIQTTSDEENYELYYLQNYSIWMDIDILMKMIFSTHQFADDLEAAAKEGA